MRAGNLFSNRSSAVLDAPEPLRVPKDLRTAGLKRSVPVTEMPLRRAAAYDYPDDEAGIPSRERRGLRISLRDGLIPRSLWGRIAAACIFALVAGGIIAALLEFRSFLLHDARFTVPDEQAIEISGASHLTHAQLLSVFGEDVDRNIFTIPLNARRTELERLPWVEHATVMRLLPDHVRVALVERTPVAFVRQGGHIGLADATGALFDLPSPEMVAAAGGNAPHYSFPVLTGISANDPLSTRAARMKIYMGFMAALDATGEKISSKLSEVDVSDPEDVRAVVPDTGGSDVLVHFGDDKFLDRYHAYRQHLPEWRAQYPRLASADMRYNQQVVLGMKPDAPASSPVPASSTAAALSTASAPATSTPTAPPTAHADPPPPSAALNSIAKTRTPATKPAISKPPAHVVAHRAAAKSSPLHRAKHAKAQPKKMAASHAKAKPSSSPTHAVSEVAR